MNDEGLHSYLNWKREKGGGRKEERTKERKREGERKRKEKKGPLVLLVDYESDSGSQIRSWSQVVNSSPASGSTLGMEPT